MDSNLDGEKGNAWGKSERVVGKSVGCGYEAVRAGERGGLGGIRVDGLKTLKVRLWQRKYKEADLTC